MTPKGNLKAAARSKRIPWEILSHSEWIPKETLQDLPEGVLEELLYQPQTNANAQMRTHIFWKPTYLSNDRIDCYSIDPTHYDH